jgi:hypothetical protein
VLTELRENKLEKDPTVQYSRSLDNGVADNAAESGDVIVVDMSEAKKKLSSYFPFTSPFLFLSSCATV